MVRLTKIYTRTGDDGSTALVDGSRVPKDDPRVEAYGTVDEVNTHLGVCRVYLNDAFSQAPLVTEPVQEMDLLLARIQQQLFDLGSLLATPASSGLKLPPITDAHVTALEVALDFHNAPLEALKSFILPGGHPLAAQLHVVRVVCRRAERLCIQVDGVDEAGRRIVPYLNRLSDLCFVLARFVNHHCGVPEPLWTPGGPA
jgi:cob(I)alamin adenosyltransferase